MAKLTLQQALDKSLKTAKQYVDAEVAKKADSSHTHNYAGSSSAGGAANSVKTNLIIKLNGGSTEGTDLFTFNGSAAKTVNITPSSIGAAASSHGTHIGTKVITSGYDTAFRTQTKGDANSGSYLTTIRADASGVTNAPQYGTGLAWGRGDTHGYLYLKYNSAEAYLGAGSADKLTWTKKLAFSDHTHNYAGSSSAGGAATSANKVNTNLAIKLNGGTTEGTDLFTFNGSTAKTVNITPSSIGASPANNHNHKYFEGGGTSGTSGYVAFAQLKITGAYANRPIEFKLICRGKGTSCTVNIAFSNVNGTDPGLSSLRYWGSDYGVFAHKTDTSTWLLYHTKSESYDNVTVVNCNYGSQSITITYPGTFITAKPTSNVTNATLGGSFGNANTVGGYSVWVGTQAQYNAISSKSSTTIYYITE